MPIFDVKKREDLLLAKDTILNFAKLLTDNITELIKEDKPITGQELTQCLQRYNTNKKRLNDSCSRVMSEVRKHIITSPLIQKDPNINREK